MEENAEDVELVISWNKSATDFFFQWCDGKFADEDLSEKGSVFISKYYGKDYFSDYVSLFGELMFDAPEEKHDFKEFANLVNRRYTEYFPA